MGALAIPQPLISVGEYHAMIANGTLDENDRVELIHGRLERMMPKNPEHDASILHIQMAFVRSVPEGWFAYAQASLTLDDSEPEPDVMVVRGQADDYWHRHPGAADLGLVVEVSHSTLQGDRGVKRRLYASCGIPCYWIANLQDGTIEVYGNPVRGDYVSCRHYAFDEEVPLILDGVHVCSFPVSRLVRRPGPTPRLAK